MPHKKTMEILPALYRGRSLESAHQFLAGALAKHASAGRVPRNRRREVPEPPQTWLLWGSLVRSFFE